MWIIIGYLNRCWRLKNILVSYIRNVSFILRNIGKWQNVYLLNWKYISKHKYISSLRWNRKNPNFDKLDHFFFYYRRKYKSFNYSFIFTKPINIYVMMYDLHCENIIFIGFGIWRNISMLCDMSLSYCSFNVNSHFFILYANCFNSFDKLLLYSIICESFCLPLSSLFKFLHHLCNAFWEGTISGTELHWMHFIHLGFMVVL